MGRVTGVRPRGPLELPLRVNATRFRTIKTVIDIVRNAKFLIGQVVRHRIYPFRGIIFDVDPTFSNTEQWWESIPEDVRPRRDQPFYHLLAENAETTYVAYVSEQNLLEDNSGEPVNHPDIALYFEQRPDGGYARRAGMGH